MANYYLGNTRLRVIQLYQEKAREGNETARMSPSPVLPIFCSPQARFFARSLARSPSLENGKETSVTQPKLIIIHLNKDTE